MLRISFVDYRQWYSPYLIKSLNRLCPNMVSIIYLPKSHKATPFSQEKRFLNTSDSQKVWSTYTYPFDILKKALSDGVDLIHIQWEFNEFGIFYASLLLPLLLLFLRIAKIKCVTTIHSVIPRFSFGLNLPGFSLPRGTKIFAESSFIMLYKMVVSLSNAVIVHGESLKILLLLDYKAKPEKVFTIPYGVPPTAYSLKLSNGFDATLPQGSEVILALGAVSPRKGLDTLIKAFEKISSEHPSWILIIAGHVPIYYKYYYQHLKEIAPNLIEQKRVIFLGEFSLQDTDRLMEMSKVVVFPYIYNFGASSTLTFALQHRKVVVISALNFAKDLLRNGENAILTPPENPTLLANAIERAMCDDSLRSTIQVGIADLLERSSWDFVAKETLRVYIKAIKRNNGIGH